MSKEKTRERMEEGVSDKEFLQWLLDRLIHVYGESPNVDFVHRLRAIVEAAE